MASPEKELQGAIVARLRADATVASLVNGRIYDNVPTSAVFPYVSIGPVDSVQDDADCIIALEVAQQIDCWSRVVGSVECKAVVDAVRTALHDYSPDLATNAVVFFQHRTSRVVDDPDGITHHGILGFEAVIERPASGDPANTAAPVVSGSATVGSVLSSTTGTWSNSPTGYAYQWQRQ